MKNLFTISDFASLRNININSLRYYEKLGLLKPIKIDPETKYRYYASEQLAQLDAILLCIQVGIPLKELTNYFDENGEIERRRLLEDGRRIAQKRMSEIELGIKKIEYSLGYLETISSHENQDTAYVRHVGKRQVILAPYEGDISDAIEIERNLQKLYRKAQDRNLSPVLPSGILLEYVNGRPQRRLFFDIMESNTDEEDILTIPEGDFLCLQAELLEDSKILDKIENDFRRRGHDGTFIVSNMMLSKYRFGNNRSEIQLRLS